MTGPEIQAGAPVAAPEPVARDSTIDFIRGFCIISMVVGHIAGASVLADVLHLVPKFDGASGFVLLGGLVLGIVQSRRVSADGLGAVEAKSLKRLVVIYGAQLGLIALGLTAAFGGWDSTNFPDVQALTGGEVVANVLLMTLAPPGGDVLRLYVFMLALAMGSYIMLARGQWVTVLALSAAIHVVGQYFPSFSSFSPFSEQARSSGWAGWQLLFISALVLGWHWRQLDAVAWLDYHRGKVLAGGVAVVVVAAATSQLVSPAWEEALFSKYTFPLGRIAVAYAVIAAMYVVVRGIVRRFPTLWLRPVVLIGAHSLDSYIIQAVSVVLIFGFNSMDSTTILAQLLAIAVLAVCWGWAELRALQKAAASSSRTPSGG